MTDDLDQARAVIERTRTIYRKAHDRIVSHGIEPVDSAIAALYAVVDMAGQFQPDTLASIAWMRDAVDQFERQAMGERHGTISRH